MSGMLKGKCPIGSRTQPTPQIQQRQQRQERNWHLCRRRRAVFAGVSGACGACGAGAASFRAAFGTGKARRYAFPVSATDPQGWIKSAKMAVRVSATPTHT
ncbi:uncharacterized protein ASCRUDRAFT_73357 [Ascoidea rubescens DSM 1968]|uniref:Uncharacterized protein n=1 Tax=Ascoidea rubescens DSM 1968 TaxID=1344418 RepID=A0A1D2VPI1_9ASCO|nr:hypothetical protein ASCRUDRAFT_73357 [Ascoidea rubescens DSM 1968]ODV63518.1 hypothetical protein ASCRUDRAFT_73357 [Ascoidea rubescens DSM 1968]